MNTALLLGLGMGTGILLILTGLFPARLPLEAALAALHRPRPEGLRNYDVAPVRPSLMAGLAGPTLARTAWGARMARRVGADLRVTGTSPADHLAARAGLAVTGLAWAPATAALMAVGGVHTGVAFPLWCSIVLAPLGFTYPAMALRSRAAQRRHSFRHALGAFLDIVGISLAAGRGVESALNDAADAGEGWAFAELRRCLLETRLHGETPWAGLARLGEDLGIPELGELAASAGLAGTEGARVRVSLAAKARSLRLKGLTEIEARAQSASERMSLPVVALMAGFIVFVTYPAVEQVLHGL